MEKSEAQIQKEIIEYLLAREWFVKKIHGNAITIGVPDLYAAHKFLGARWIEVKKPGGKLRPSQVKTCCALHVVNIGVWVLCSADVLEYQKLKGPPNWRLFL